MRGPLVFSNGGAIGPDSVALQAALYVSNKNETVRMFDSDFMEFFSRVHPVIPLVLYLPVVGYMLYVSLWRQGFPVVVVVGFFCSVFSSGR